MLRKTHEFCLPTAGKRVPSGPDWIHEIKYDGYRLRIEREGDRVRLFTRSGLDWTARYPRIVEAALKNRKRQFILDGEGVVLDVRGVSDFQALHSRKHDHEAQFYAFDVLAMDGDDTRKRPLLLRKNNLAQLLKRETDGIFLASFERGAIGPELFRHACAMGLEGLVSKHVERSYWQGRCGHWIKSKNPEHPSMRRAKDRF